MVYCTKTFLTDTPEPATSSVCCFSGVVQWRKELEPELVQFVEVANCDNKARLHRTNGMTEMEWLSQVERLRDELNKYLIYGYNKVQEGLMNGGA